MLKFFVRRPITTLMFVLVWVLLGLVAYPKINIERTPSIDFPYVTATFIYPGATPEELESQVVKKAENAMSEVAGVKKITSQIYENSAFVISEFNLGVNVDDKANEVKAKTPIFNGECAQRHLWIKEKLSCDGQRRLPSMSHCFIFMKCCT